MKKLTLTLLVISGFTFLAQAQNQTEKGKYVIGLNSSINKHEAENGEFNKNVRLSPTVGYFIKNDLAVGAQIGFISAKSETNKTRGLGYGIFATQYFPVSNKVKFFTTASISSDREKYTSIGSNQYNRTSQNYNLTVIPGLSFFPTNKFAVELSVPALNLNFEKDTYHNTPQNNEKGINFDTYAFQYFPTISFKFHL